MTVGDSKEGKPVVLNNHLVPAAFALPPRSVWTSRPHHVYLLVLLFLDGNRLGEVRESAQASLLTSGAAGLQQPERVLLFKLSSRF